MFLVSGYREGFGRKITADRILITSPDSVKKVKEAKKCSISKNETAESNEREGGLG